jgi:NADPH:quinone reductase-like Zn-dependent oxidoreductase
VLTAGEGEEQVRAQLVRERLELAPPEDREVLVRPLYGCWEGNMDHALSRRPIDVCRQRREPKVVIGNSGVVRVIEVGAGARTVKPGDLAILFCAGQTDRFGYPEKIMGYDQSGSMGCLATRMRCRDENLIPIPEGSRFSLAQWAAFSLRYVTAWSNWELAFATFRHQVSRDELWSPHVWGWGGGTTFAELTLAQHFGCRAAMLSASDKNLEVIGAAGIVPIDRRRWGSLDFDEARYQREPSYRDRYLAAEAAFLEEVRRRTDREMVHVFVDFVGGPIYRATLKALAREAVITTAGWKEGMRLSQLRAKECIDRHQHVFTHYARYRQGQAAVAFAEQAGWMPEVDPQVYTFDEVPQLAEDYRAGRTGYFPCYSIDPE